MITNQKIIFFVKKQQCTNLEANFGVNWWLRIKKKSLKKKDFISLAVNVSVTSWQQMQKTYFSIENNILPVW